MGLLDVLQGASNSAASGVSGPVDMLAWALRKAGVPVPQNPVMGEQWMREKGLLATPQNKYAGAAGETLGLLAPFGAAAKAPQIAKGLLAAEDAGKRGAYAVGEKANDMAGSYMAQQGLMKPATVWHGSPHKFDRFDSSKIGTGEGAQAYGHGLYLAESPDVARGYQTKLAGGTVVDSRGVPTDSTATTAELEKALRASGLSWDEAERASSGWMSAVFNGKTADLHPVVQREVAARGLAPKMQGALYKVDLPDDKIARMMDWDKPLSQNPQPLRDVFSAAMKKDGYESYVVDGQRVYLGLGEEATLKGRDAYRRLHEHAIRSGKAEPAAVKEAEMVRWLRNAGVPGVRYLDGGSRSAGGGTSNFVVFPGEENALKILERR